MDSDDLLVEEDLLKPDPASLRSMGNVFSLINFRTLTIINLLSTIQPKIYF